MIKGSHHSESARMKVSKTRKGKPLSEEHKKKLSEANILERQVISSDSVDYKRLLYEAHYKYRHTENLDCPTWYDGCNCLIPFDDFDNEYWAKIFEEMSQKK